MLFPIEVVHWNDACGREGWTPMESSLGLELGIVSVGIIVEDTDTHLTITDSVYDCEGPPGSTHSPVSIPAAMVHSRKKIGAIEILDGDRAQWLPLKRKRAAKAKK